MTFGQDKYFYDIWTGQILLWHLDRTNTSMAFGQDKYFYDIWTGQILL